MQMLVTENWYRPGWNALVVYCRHVQRHRFTILIYSYTCICLCLRHNWLCVNFVCFWHNLVCIWELTRKSQLSVGALFVRAVRKSYIKSSKWQLFKFIQRINFSTTSCEHECNRDDNQNQTNVLFIVAVVNRGTSCESTDLFWKGHLHLKKHMKTTYFASVVYFKLELQTHSGQHLNLHLENRAL